MLAQNVLAVFLVQAEARNRALLAGVLDCLMWPAGMITTTITVTALQGHHAGLKGEVTAAVTLANFVGSSAAVRLGRRFIRARRRWNGTATSAEHGGHGDVLSRRQLPGLSDGPRGVDQPDVAERLREVPDHLTSGRVDLLGQRADIVG